MIAIKRILCPVDFSEFSRHALEQAVVIARHYGGEITALHAFVVPPAAAAIGGDGTWVPIDQTEARAAYETERASDLASFVAAIVPADVAVKRGVVEGGVVNVILQEAAALPADLIVMGTHGRSGFERMLLGSVTERVLRKAPVPVLTVPRRMSGVMPAIRRILVPVDFSKASIRALSYAVSLAREAQAEVTVHYVIEFVPDPASYQYRLINMPEYYAQVSRAAQEEMEGAIERVGGGYERLRPRITRGKAYKEILRVAAEEQADLIFMGVQGRGAADLLMFGSTANHVVRAAACPVMTIQQAVEPPETAAIPVETSDRVEASTPA